MSTENRLRAALAARAGLVTEASLRRGSLPTDDRQRSAPRPRTRALPPLLAAAVVVAIGIVATVVSSPSADRRQVVGPASGAPPTPGATVSPAPSPTTATTPPPTRTGTPTTTPTRTPEALRVADLLDAPVPSLCGHPAGHLVNGLVPGIPAGEGSVVLLRAAGAPLPVFGDLDGDGVADAAAVVLCRAAAGAPADRVVLWSAAPTGPRLLGAFDPATVGGGPAPTVRQLGFSDGAVHVEADDLSAADGACCASARVTLTLRWDGSRIVVDDVQHVVGAHSGR